MKKLPLTQGKFAIVDDEDFEWLNKSKWYVSKKGKTFYAKRGVGGRKNRKTLLMHSEIIKKHNFCGIGGLVDHIDGDGLNNQKYNLRACTNSQNLQNRGPQKNNTSGFKGVGLHRGTGKWAAELMVNGERKRLGLFADKVEAAKAYDRAAKKYHGEFAYLNERIVQCV